MGARTTDSVIGALPCILTKIDGYDAEVVAHFETNGIQLCVTLPSESVIPQHALLREIIYAAEYGEFL